MSRKPQRSALATSLLFFLTSAFASADWNSSSEMPGAAKASAPSSLRLSTSSANAVAIVLAPVDASEIDAVKRLNSEGQTKRLQIGIGREMEDARASSRALIWHVTEHGLVAQWQVTSQGASAIRVEIEPLALEQGTEIRFVGLDHPGTVYGPIGRDSLVSGGAYWSPVLEGDTALIEVSLPVGALPSRTEIHISQLSHLFVSPANADIDRISKAAQFCEVDFICRSVSDAALANAGRAVARMTFSDGVDAATYLCTGTLLNPISSTFTPYFYSAAHCISTQASANTLTTHWFYDRTSCGSGVTSPNYVQVAGGATLLYVNKFYDALLLQLNLSPPAGAYLSGWNAATLTSSTALTAIHHPSGDRKKVSLGNVTGFGSPNGATGPNFVVANWTSGVTEGGSSGSGIFTAVGNPPSDYSLRGGLWGGASSCSARTSPDYYSRFDIVYPAIAQFLNPASVSCNFSLSPTSISVGAASSSASFGVSTPAGCAWSAVSQVPWISTSSVGNGSGLVTYAISPNSTGARRTGVISVGGQPFAVSQQAAVSTGTNLVSNPDFEFGTSNWSQSATGGTPIIYQDPAVAHGGQWLAWLGGYNSGMDTLHQEITIPSGATQASLRFWYLIATNETTASIPYDVLTIRIASATTGATLATLGTLSNVNKTSGWVQSGSYDLSAFTGQTIRLVLSASMDFSNITNFFIDDVTVTAVSAASTLTVSRAGSGSGFITSSPTGISCGSICTTGFPAGSVVTLTATAMAGSSFGGWSGACAGVGACTVTLDTSKSVTALFSPAPNPPRMSNISTRMQVLTGNDVMIGGFVIGGAASKTVVVRARGPSLAPFGITNALVNPTLQLVRSSDQATIATNDDWESAPNADAVSASGFAPSHSAESAILVSLPPGAYTAIVAGQGGGVGVGIVEVFEVDSSEVPLANISTRGQVRTGNDVMIGGFVVQGSGPQTVVVRARGPSLIPFGITNALPNPSLQLVRSSDQATMGANDNWQQAINASAIMASGFAPSDPLEAAILLTLDPGAYTAVVTGAGNTTGVGIVEVFIP